MKHEKKIRVLGKGLTAQAIKEKFPQSILYDESDFSLYDKTSNDITIVSPGIPPSNFMVKNSSNIMSDYDLMEEKMPFCIWISGTNGKTTTTQMIQHLLKDKGSLYGGNIGTPLFALDTKASIWILETSSFTLHYTNKARPNLYILLPISQDHISWHGSYKEYQKAKLKPLDRMKEGEIAIIPKEFENYPTKALKIVYNSSYDLCNEFNIKQEDIKFKEPFLLDSLLALACQKILFDEISYEKINSFVIDEHKVEEFRDKRDRLWVDDSKATNTDASINALIPYKDKRILLILGGVDKKVDLISLFEYMKNLDIEIYLIGLDYVRFEKLCKKYEIAYIICKTLENAVSKMSEKHDQNSLAILSPSTSSYDQFDSYIHRGKEFKKLVNNLSLN